MDSSREARGEALLSRIGDIQGRLPIDRSDRASRILSIYSAGLQYVFVTRTVLSSLIRDACTL